MMIGTEFRTGCENFAKMREENLFYIDKTSFLPEWWGLHGQSAEVALVTRPRRFGKTLMMSTVEYFFSTKYAGRKDLFEDLEVWKNEEMRGLQGTYPVIFLSFASVKAGDFVTQRALIVDEILSLYSAFEKEGPLPALDSIEQDLLSRIRYNMDDATLMGALKFLCKLNYLRHGKKTIILLDEYDTPIHESFVQEYWKKMVVLLRGIFNKTFKGNEYMARGILTGITRVSKESMFSDMNNITVASTTTELFETSFGFTEKEVINAMKIRGLDDYSGVKEMYDGFMFGKVDGIYNPWSIISYLASNGKLEPWWSNTSGNAMAVKLIKDGNTELKQDFMTLLDGGSIQSEINERIVFDQLNGAVAVYGLLLAAGYLKIVDVRQRGVKKVYTLRITNEEVRITLSGLVLDWFFMARSAYNSFIDALETCNLQDMNNFMNEVAFNCLSSFDTGGTTETSEPERFYHGFVMGLLVELREKYIMTSNRESGKGRYDVMLEPRNPREQYAFILEFKVNKPDSERSLEDTVASALAQIEERHYDQQLIERGIPKERIRKYGFAFRGKEVLIGQKSQLA